MNPDLTFWDHVSLAAALVFVLVFIIIRIKQFIESPSGSCGSCSGGGCGTSYEKPCPKDEQEKQNVTINAVEYIKLKH